MKISRRAIHGSLQVFQSDKGICGPPRLRHQGCSGHNSENQQGFLYSFTFSIYSDFFMSLSLTLTVCGESYGEEDNL